MSFRSLSPLIPAFAFLTGLALLPSTALAQAPRASKVDDATLRNAAQGNGEEWLSYGFTPQETRYTPLDQINASTFRGWASPGRLK